MSDFDVIVLGGGAAGLMCAIAAGQRGQRVLVLEGSNRIGKKILMSGGGRCNFTNLYCEPGHFLSANPKFCISALKRYTPHEFVALVDQHAIPYHEKTAGQLFCDRSSKDIVALLAAECAAAQVRIETHSPVVEVGVSAGGEAGTEFANDEGFAVTVPGGRFRAAALVVATGGLSIPKMGASDIGYRLAQQFGHALLPTRAALVPFTFSGGFHEVTQRLSGVSVPVKLENAAAAFRDNILFTHRGMSGPAALQLSSYWREGETIVADLLPGADAHALLLHVKTSQPKTLLRSALHELLPKALVSELQAALWPDHADTPLAQIGNAALATVASALNGWTLRPAGTEGYRTAEVTLGGVATDELSSQTMESRRQRGLYFVGEVVDVTGHLGGFNFQWAWASGQAAGKAIAQVS